MEPNQSLGDLLNSYSGSASKPKPPSNELGLGSLLDEYGTRSRPQLPQQTTPASVEEFVKQVAPAAERVAQRLNVPVEAVIGQWGLETGWGKKVIPGTNNLGNIKDTSGGGVAATDNMTGSRDRYRQYQSVDQFADDFSNLIGNNGRYASVVGTRDPQTYFTNLKAGGYAEDPNYVASGTRAAQMAAQALKSVPATQPQQQPAGPDLGRAPKWADIEAKPEFKALDDATKAQTKAAYFDYWIAPNAGGQAAQLREQFLAAKPAQQPGMMTRIGNALSGMMQGAQGSTPTGEPTNEVSPEFGGPAVTQPSGSVLEGTYAPAPAPLQNDASKIPVRPETRQAFNGLWDNSTPEKRQELATRPGWVGALARERLEQNQRLDAQIAASKPQPQTGLFGETTTPEQTMLQRASGDLSRGMDTRVEERERRLLAKGYAPDTARLFAQEAAQYGVRPGKEEEYIQFRSGSIKPSDFDFETSQIFDPKAPSNGLNNVLVRGLAKGGLGIAKTATGWGEFLSDVYGLKGAGDAAREASDAIRGKEAALGERGDFLSRNFEGAINSISQQLPLLIGGVKAGSQAIPLAGMAVQTFSQEYSDGRERGQTPGEAVTRASIFAAFEVIGEKFGLKEQMAALKGAAQGMPSDQIIDFFWRALKKEVPGELLTTTGQFSTDKFMPKGIGLNPNATFNDYVKQVADTIAQTLMQSGTMAGGTTGVSNAVRFLREGDTTSPEAQLAAALQADIDSRMFTREGINEDVVRSMNPNNSIMVPPRGGPIVLPDGRVEPTFDANNLPADEPPAAPPAAPPAPVPPVNRAPGAEEEETYTDQEVQDYAEQRLTYLWSKREGTLDDNVDPFTGEPAGTVLTPTEQEELNNLERADGDVAALRGLYGFQPPSTQENQDVQGQTQDAPDGLAPSEAPDAQAAGPADEVPEQRGQQPDEAQEEGLTQAPAPAPAPSGFKPVDVINALVDGMMGADRITDPALRQALVDRGLVNAQGLKFAGQDLLNRLNAKGQGGSSLGGSGITLQQAQQIVDEALGQPGAPAPTAAPAPAPTAAPTPAPTPAPTAAPTPAPTAPPANRATGEPLATFTLPNKSQPRGVPLADIKVYQLPDGRFTASRGFQLGTQGMGSPAYTAYAKATQDEAVKDAVEDIRKRVTSAQTRLNTESDRNRARQILAYLDTIAPAETAAAPAPTAAPAPAGPDLTQNTTFKADAVAAARERMKAKLAAMNKPDAPKMMAQDGSLDPEMMQDGITMAGAYIEAGVKGYKELEAALVGDLGEAIRPFVRTFYEAVRYYPGFNNTGMTPAAEIDAAPAETSAAPAVEEASTPVAEPADLFTPEGKIKVAREIADFFIGGGSFATIIEARKKISELIGRPIEAATELAKQADETIEVAVVLAGREMVQAGRQQGRTPQVIYDRLVSLYNAQPNLAVRSSTSVRDQAYSTPVPLAYVASELAGITYDTKVLEPTAGNGMLLIGASTANSTANELNPKRADMLTAMGFKATTRNAATDKLRHSGYPVDAVVANPPFGATKDANGQTIIYEVSPTYGTREVDHAIVFKSLETMKDDGRAVLIVGGVQAEGEDGRREGYRGKSKRDFYFNLYQQYNVTDHFTVDGALYSRQGASYPVDVIVIEGRGKATRTLPAADLPVLIRSYDELKEKLNGTRSVDAQGDRSPAGTDNGDAAAGAGDGAPVVGSPGGQGDRPGDQGRPAGDAAGVQDGGRAGDGRAAGSGTVPGAGESQPAGEPGRGDGRPAVPAAGEGQRGSEPAAQGNRPDDVGGPSTVDGQRVESGLSDRRGQEQETATQVEYRPVSAASSVGTLVPVAMRDAIQASLARLQDKVGGDLDQYVSAALQMDLDALRAGFSAEQVDALALAIDNAESGRGFIIGDQTGIGKGRVVAGMIRYALVSGKIPIFVTEKPNLYADMIRDLDDIGMTGDLGLEAARSRILMTNAAESVPYVLLRNVNGEVTEVKLTLRAPATGAALNQKFKDMVEAGNLGEYKVIFTTYSQLQTVAGKVTDRMRFVQHFGSGNYMIFDESHNAGGAGEQQARTKDQREKAKAGESLVTGRASFVRGLVRNAYGTFFSSATYAKRPDVMDLYSSTNMKLAVDKLSQLAEAIKSGGVPMQQVVANMLTTDGQYIRRERTFAGVSYETTETEVNKETAENMASAMRSVLAFSRAKEAVIKNMQKEFDKEGKLAGDVGGEKTTVQGANFGSIMHNLIDQMLLALKAPQAVQYAIERAKAGEKVVLTVSNTMGSFLKDYAEEMGLTNGDPVALSFKDLYLRYLEKQRMIKIKAPGGQPPITRRLTDEELGPQLVKMFNDIQTQIENAGFGAAPVSPIDFMHAELRKAGLKTDEITGRTATVNYEAGTPKLASRNANIRQRLAAISGFNNGNIDVLILNQSGSTGLSLHASNKFKDQRKRHMIIVQAEKNIDTHMQMLGRVHRTGQVIAPAYSQMMADIPAEMRPAAVLLKKMASLNANTTASRKSSVTAEGVVDFMNDYGGQVVYEFLQDNRDVLEAVGGNKVMSLPDDAEDADEDLIRKFTGYVPILPIEQQERIYSDLIDRYNDLIERENSLGTNKLEAKAVDLDAETVSSTPLTQSKDDPSIFAQPANMERVDVKRTVKPYSSAEVQKLVSDRLTGETGAQIAATMMANLRAKGDSYIAKVVADMQARQTEPVKINSQRDLLTAVKNHALTVLDNYPIGSTISIKDKIGQIIYGVITDIKQSGRTANPAAGSDWKMTIALANGEARSISITFSQIGSKYTLSKEGRVNSWNGSEWEFMPLLKVFDTGLNTRREKRWIVTGNILAGYSKFPGQIISYTKKDGTTGQGVLMSRQFDFEKEKGKAALNLQNAEQVLQVMTDVPGILVGTEDGNFKIMGDGRSFRFIVPSSKREGGTYFLDKDLTDLIGNDFYKRGGQMVAVTYDRDTLSKVASYIIGQREEPLYALTLKDRARTALGLDENGQPPKYNTQDDYDPTGNSVPDASPDTERAIQSLGREIGGPYATEGALVGWSNDAVRAVLPVAQALGVQVVGVKVNSLDPGAKRFNGVYWGGRVFLNVEATRPHLAVLGHEVGHQMKVQRPDLYRRMVEAIDPYIKKGAYEQRFRASAVARGLDADNAKEEFIGEVLSDGFMDPAFWQALGNKNKQLLVQVQAFVARILQRVQALAGYTPRTAEYLTDYAAVMRIAGEVMAEYGLNQGNLLKAAGVTKFNFAGENAADSLFIRDNLETAEDMERQGEDAQTIRMATGWFRAPYDKKWRYELMTDGVKLIDWATLDESKLFQPNITVSLDKILDYPSLFNAYPEARDIKVMKRGAFMDVFGGVQGWYDTDKNTIAVTPYAQNPLSTILHEVQHWIQTKEGFATGANPDTAFDLMPLDKKREVIDRIVASMNRRVAEAQKSVDAIKLAMDVAGTPDGEALRKVMAEWSAIIKVAKDPADPRRMEIFRRMAEIEKRVKDAIGYQPGGWTSTGLDAPAEALTALRYQDVATLQKRLDDNTKALQETTKLRDDAAAGDEKAVRDAMKRTGDNFALYKAVAGEIEARDVQARMGMTPEQRDNTAPFTSEQFDPKDVLVTYGDGTSAEQQAPKFQMQDDDPTQPTGLRDRVQRNILQFWGSRDPNLRTMSVWDRTLSTQFNKALKDKHFGKVFALGNAMQNHVSLASIRPAELAPGIVPRIDDFMGAMSTLARGRSNNKALAGATRALFAGTLAGNTVVEGRVWSHDELRSQFGLDDTGIALYEQARAAIDASMDEVAAAEAYSLAQSDVPKSLRRLIIDQPGRAQALIDNAMSRNIGMARQALRTAQAANALQERLDELQAEIDRRIMSKARVDAVFRRSAQLKAAGYAPLMRFGKFTVTVYAVDETGNRRRDANGDSIVSYFRMHETQAEANADRRRVESMIGDSQEYEVQTGTRSELKHELYQGISPETLAMFAEEVGADAALKKFYEVALTERSALKRRLERKNTRGFDEDLPRVLASFITSNGRFASQRFFLRDFNNAIKFVPKEKGDVLDEAIKLRGFLMDPTDSGANISGLMFAWFLGGSVASAVVNLSQPLTMSAPYLSKFSSRALSAKKALADAVPQAMGAKQITDRDLRAALKRAGQEGIVDAQEIFHLYGQAAQGISAKMANTLVRIPGAARALRQGGESARARAEAFFTLWGMMFAKAEGFNRRLTFIAAWNMARARNETNPYAFAVRAVNETQGIYNKINRPNLGRNTIGRTVLTFKQYSIMYLELVRRMWKSGPEGKRAVFYMLAVLMLLSGEEGLPFSQDLDDLIDTIGQLMGYDTNMKRSKRRMAYEILGKQGGDLFLYGVSSVLPLDFSGRLGMGNLIPGTGMFKVSGAANQAREVAEVVGPAGSFAVSIMDAFEAAAVGNYAKAAENMSPKAVKDARAGADMALTGTAKDTRGRKNMDVDLVDAAVKSVGFQPTKLADANRARSPIMQDRALQKKMEESIVDLWARGIAMNDEKMQAEAKQTQAEWNATNPNTPVYITGEQLRKAAQSYKQDQDSRIKRSMPRELRERAGLDLAK